MPLLRTGPEIVHGNYSRFPPHSHARNPRNPRVPSSYVRSSEVTEPFLIRAGLIVKDDQGRRQLTALGHEHLQRKRKDGVNIV